MKRFIYFILKCINRNNQPAGTIMGKEDGHVRPEEDRTNVRQDGGIPVCRCGRCCH